VRWRKIEWMQRRAVLRYLSVWGTGIALSGRIPMHGVAASGPGNVVFNQSGYLPNGDKVASVQVEDQRDLTFQICSEKTGRNVLGGRLTDPLSDAASGYRVALADFSRLTTPGAYRLLAQGVRSQLFMVGSDVYENLLLLSMRAFYGQRCGCAVDLGDGYRHPACHASGAYHPSSGRTGELANSGGWHDAGDYGRYVVNSGITTGTLLWAWELFPRSLRGLSLRIPESGGKLPDYLAEIRWNLEWMLSMQDVDGGVWHKQTSGQFCGFVMPQDDKLTSYVIGTGATPYKSTCATASLAAVMAIAARCYGAHDTVFAERCLAAAERGWTWALAHPDVGFVNPPGIATGGYEDVHCNDEILWASAELWRTTGKQAYEQAFLREAQTAPPETAVAAPSWSNVAPLGYWTYVLAGGKAEDKMRSRIVAQTAAAAQTLVARRRSSGYGNTLDLADYVWGSNSLAANQSLLLLIANQLQPDPRMLETALGNLHYLLGRNCFGVSWVTQVGTDPLLHPHHRPSMADQLDRPWPGLLCGGPNAKPTDKVAQGLAKLPPMRMWVDDAMAFSVNEVAINWNAPLVFLLAGANAHAYS
jgi:endoglucanase